MTDAIEVNLRLDLLACGEDYHLIYMYVYYWGCFRNLNLCVVWEEQGFTIIFQGERASTNCINCGVVVITNFTHERMDKPGPGYL